MGIRRADLIRAHLPLAPRRPGDNHWCITNLRERIPQLFGPSRGVSVLIAPAGRLGSQSADAHTGHTVMRPVVR